MANFATLMHGELADVLRELERGDCDTQELGAALCNVIRKVQSTPPPNLPYPFPAAGGGCRHCLSQWNAAIDAAMANDLSK